MPVSAARARYASTSSGRYSFRRHAWGAPLKIWMASAPISSARPIALSTPPAVPTCAPIFMDATILPQQPLRLAPQLGAGVRLGCFGEPAPAAGPALAGVRGLGAAVEDPRLNQPGQPGGGHLRVDAEVALAVEGAGADEVHAGLADADLQRRAVRHQLAHVARDPRPPRRRARPPPGAPPTP